MPRAGPKPGSWDYGLEFDTIRRTLVRIYEAETGKRKVYAAALLIQLLNGLRAREAWRALQHYISTGQREFYLTPGKNGNPRPVRIPELIKYREEYSWVLSVPPAKARKRLHKYARIWLGANTHSLRYAFVSYLARQGVPAQVIARITGHKKLDNILRYTQSVTAEDILKQLVK